MKAILFITSELTGLSLDIYKDVQLEAKKRGVALITYCGKSFHNSSGDRTPESHVYDFIDRESIIGVILNGGAVGQFSPSEYLSSFVSSLSPLPVVSLSFPIKNTTNILVDNYRGIYELINHLIKDHSYRQIGFVKGPNGHPEAEERLNAYLNALKDNGIDVDNSLIAEGDFSEDAGINAVKKFLNSAKSNIDAIACVDDDSALGVYNELKNRGIKIPSEIAVCGFDDIEQAKNLIPSLTTVAQPYKKMITNAFDEIESTIKRDLTVPTLTILRESCGCKDKEILAAGENVDTVADFNMTRELFLNSDLEVSQSWKKVLLDSLERDLETNRDSFIDELTVLIDETEKINTVHNILTALVKLTPISLRSRSKFHQARLLINKYSNRMCSSRILTYKESTVRLNHLISAINQAENNSDLKDILKASLTELNIENYVVVLFKKNQDEAEIYFNNRNTNNLENYINPKKLLSGSTLRLDNRSNILVKPMITNGEMIGYIVSSVNPDNTEIFNTLNSQVGGVLYRLSLKMEREKEQTELENRNRSIQELITPMLDLIKNVTLDSKNEIEEMMLIKQAIGVSNSNLNRTIEMLKQISIKIDAVMKSVTTINDISENVNVLAINTSIQSAHAGEYGKAFGVIAKEIRKLSDSTAINAKTITEELNSTIMEFKKFTDINYGNVETFEKFTGQINHFMDVFSNIASQMETLSNSSLNIIDIMHS